MTGVGEEVSEVYLLGIRWIGMGAGGMCYL